MFNKLFLFGFIFFLFFSYQNTFAFHKDVDSCNVKKELSKKELDVALAQIKRNSFEYNKLMDTKKFISKNCLNVNQIIILSTIFREENNRLEIAKYSHDFCFDKENYHKLKGIFGSKKSKNEFINFFNSKK